MNILFKVCAGMALFCAGMFCMRLVDMHVKKINPANQLIALADGFLVSRSLHTVAELSIADELINGEKSAQEIARALHLDADAVYRLLRFLAAHGVFTQTKNNTFALNDIASLIIAAHPKSLRGFLLYEDDARWQAYGKMKYTIETGKPAFNHLFKEGYFDYIARDKKRSEQFDLGMASISNEESKLIATHFNFKPYNVIVDVGGGVGALMTAILNNNKNASGIIYELPHVAQLAHAHIAQQGLSGRIKTMDGSFLESVIPGGDLYILKRILHDWDDATCIQILKNCAAAMQQDAQLVVFDCVVPDGDSYDISKDIDIVMMGKRADT